MTADFISAERTLFTRLDAPRLPARKVREIVPALVGAKIPFPVEDCVFRYTIDDGGVAACVVRRDDLRKEIAGKHADALFPAAPLLWAHALELRPAADSAAPRALVVAESADKALALTGRGGVLESASVVPLARVDSHLKLAFRGATDSITVFSCGVDCAGSVPLGDAAEFKAAALSSNDAAQWNFLTGEFAPASERGSSRAPLVAASVFCFLAACAFAAALFENSCAKQGERQARRELSDAVDCIAGRHISSRGETALREARAAAEERETRVFAPSVSGAVADVIAEAVETGVKFSHLEIRGRDVIVSGSAPSAEAAVKFTGALAGSGFRTALDGSAPAENGDGVTFLAHPGGNAQ